MNKKLLILYEMINQAERNEERGEPDFHHIGCNCRTLEKVKKMIHQVLEIPVKDLKNYDKYGEKKGELICHSGHISRGS